MLSLVATVVLTDFYHVWSSICPLLYFRCCLCNYFWPLVFRKINLTGTPTQNLNAITYLSELVNEIQLKFEFMNEKTLTQWLLQHRVWTLIV